MSEYLKQEEGNKTAFGLFPSSKLVLIPCQELLNPTGYSAIIPTVA